MRLDSLLRDLDGANPYELLGLKADATNAEIKEARRRLQRQAHPDLVDGYGDYARVINIAADLLLDHERRAMFDSGGDIAPARLYQGDPGTGKVQMPPPDEPERPSWATEPSFWDRPPARPRIVNVAMWLMYSAAISCFLLFVIAATSAGVASDTGRRMADIMEVLSFSAAPIAVWIALTVVLGTGIRQGWRGIVGAGWAFTLIILLPIGLGCGTLMSYTLAPAAAVTDTDKLALQRVPDLIEGTMVWVFPLGLVLAVAAMTLLFTPASKHYLEAMAAVRDTAERIARHRRGSPR